MKNKKTTSKIIALTVALTLLCCVVAGGTMAWLIDDGGSVTNTFTSAEVNITLTETLPENNEAQMIPGYEIQKDPTVTVIGGSEKCYVFVVIEESANFDDFMEYDIDPAWTFLEEGVYYQIIDKNENDLPLPVLKGNEVLVRSNVTNDMMTTDFSAPTLEFTAYAIQYMENESTPFQPAEAWSKAQGLS